MRITKEDLNRRWLYATILGASVFAVLTVTDLQLKAKSGFGTADLQSFTRAGQYRAAAFVWSQASYGLRAGFVLGLDYLLIPLYALSFFFSGILACEAFAPRPGRLRRILTLLAAVPIAGAVLDAVENGLELAMLVGQPGDAGVSLAHAISSAKLAAAYVGLLLLAGAVVARVAERQQKRLKEGAGRPD
jgi:hypothetical protein